MSTDAITTHDLTFRVIGRPQQRGSKRPVRAGGTNGRIILTDSNVKSKPWMDSVRAAADEAMGGRDLIAGPVELSALFYFARPKSHYRTGRNAKLLRDSAPLCHTQWPDLAKLVRCLEDAMTGVVWRDDKQVCGYRDVYREWTQAQEGATVYVKLLDGNE